MDKQEAIDILNTIYIRFMRLQFSCETVACIFCASIVTDDYPNLCWCIRVSFATDAYATIDGLMHSGRYSFATLAKDSEAINVKYKEIMRKMETIIPNIRSIRNQMFCHLVQKQTNDAIQKINTYCFAFLDCLKELHTYCCHIYGIHESELNGYRNDAFMALDRELKEFSQLVMDGSMSLFNNVLTEIQSGKSFQDAKEIRYKQIKSEV